MTSVFLWQFLSRESLPRNPIRTLNPPAFLSADHPSSADLPALTAHAQSTVARQFKLETEPRLHLWLDASPVIGQDRGLAVFGDSRQFYTYKWYPDGQTEATASDDWPLSAIEWPDIRVGSDQIDGDIS